jgi:hypothetical protein
MSCFYAITSPPLSQGLSYYCFSLSSAVDTRPVAKHSKLGRYLSSESTWQFSSAQSQLDSVHILKIFYKIGVSIINPLGLNLWCDCDEMAYVTVVKSDATRYNCTRCDNMFNINIDRKWDTIRSPQKNTVIKLFTAVEGLVLINNNVKGGSVSSRIRKPDDFLSQWTVSICGTTCLELYTGQRPWQLVRINKHGSVAEGSFLDHTSSARRRLCRPRVHSLYFFISVNFCT